ncbi:DUF4365 domain-containing protein [Candidatus Accumulibacter sp. ACC005]|uniref:DUF4365 domain-containing protein n=1 Tax=Candidatus Accumulibacter sp. ACC005 TaxID=2823331 RepID=UPI0025B971DB|nr:DUF4365 domain-containing protein [Candidatus Accumulibacter sp. ACC005]
MHLPKVGATYVQERLGIAAVQTYAARRQQIWRETGTGDVGVDGNLEFVNPEGFATSRIVAVQVKSGPSYFANPSDRGWKFYPEAKHRSYWESFPLPVLLVLHDPNSNISYWADVRQVLRSPGSAEKAFIEVSAHNILENTEAVALFETAGAQDQPFIEDLDGVLAKLLTTRSKEASFPLSHFDLFTHGLTNICRSICYGMDIVCNAVEYNLHAAGAPYGMGMGDTEHRFAFDFVKFMLAQGLAQIDYADCLIDWVDRQMQPHFVAPLTSRGRALVSLIHTEEARLVVEGKLPEGAGLHVAQEGFLAMVPESYFRRFPRIRAFQDAVDEIGPNPAQ